MTLEKFIALEKALGLRRSIVLFSTLGMTIHASIAAWEFINRLILQDATMMAAGAAAITAVTGPLAVLQGYVFKAYIEGKSSGPQDPIA